MTKKKSFFSISNFSIREAFWLAILLHLVFLLLPQAFNPFALFWKDAERLAAEPIELRFDQPQQQEQLTEEIIQQEEEQEAKTPEKTEEPPQTDQPRNEGTTNLKSLEAPPAQPQLQEEQQESIPRPREEPVEQIGDEKADERVETEDQKSEPQETKPEMTEAEKLEQRRRVQEAARSFQNMPLSDVPIEYDNDLPTSAEEMQGVIQFDTYNWNYEPYRAKMIRKIYREWVPKLYQIGFFRMGEPGRTLLSFRIEKNGRVTALLVQDGARVASYDLAAQHSVEAKYPGLATEFPPLPLGFPKDFLGVSIGYFVNMKVPGRD
jgi:outer membrane biosynthesis protein TonB